VPSCILKFKGEKRRVLVKTTTQRLFSVCVLIFVVSVVGFILAFTFQWPSEFVIGGQNDTKVGADDLVEGTVTSIPLAPWIALSVFALLARSRRWWGTLAVVVLCLLGVVFIIGAFGEALTPPTPYVSRAVLVAAGIVYGLLGLALVLLGILDLIDRVRARQ
jgi:O-antigen/teichoic acid export membrane protein